MSRRHNPAVYNPVVDVTPDEAERNKRRMGKTEAAEQDPRGRDYSIPDPAEDGDAAEEQPGTASDDHETKAGGTSDADEDRDR